MQERRIVRAVIRGRVQGVGFRAWTQRQAELRGLEGWVRNRRDGAVEAVFAGPGQDVDGMIEACREGPRGSRVTALDVSDGDEATVPAGQGGFAVLPTA